MSEVTREEFDRLCLCVDKLLLAMQDQSRISGDHLKCSSSMNDRLSRVERLADGVKDGLLCLSFRAKVAGSISNATHTEVCDHVSAAQQPAPTAEGAGVEVKSISDPVPLGRCENCGTPYYTLEGFCGTCSPSKL